MLYFDFSVALFCKKNLMFNFWAAVANGVLIFKPKTRILTWENPSQYLLSVYWCTRVTRFLRSYLTPKSFVKCSMCSYQGKGSAGSVPRSWLGGWKFCHMKTSARLAGLILAVRMTSSCIACCVFLILSIPLICSDTASRVAEAMIGAKVKNFVFRVVCFVSRIWR